jgi:hypothetical protein
MVKAHDRSKEIVDRQMPARSAFFKLILRFFFREGPWPFTPSKHIAG